MGAMIFAIPVIALILWCYVYEIVIYIFAIIAICVCPILAFLNIYPLFNLGVIIMTTLVCLGMALEKEPWL